MKRLTDNTIVTWIKKSSIGGQILSLVLISVFFVIGTKGQFLQPKNIQTFVGLAGIPIIIGLGLHQTVVLGGIDLSLEGVIAICGVIVGLLVKNKFNDMDIGFWIIPVVMVAGALIGMINGVINTKIRIPSFISTLGMSWVFFGIAILISQGKSIPISDLRFQGIVNDQFLGIPNILLIAIVFFVILQLVQSKTKYGKHLYAIGGDEQLAKQAGVKVDRIKIITFMIAGVFYGLAALFLVTRLNSSAARLGNNLMFPTMTAVAVGGVALTGGIGGAKNVVIGAIIIAALNNGLVLMKVNPFIQDAMNGLVLIIAVALTIDRKKLGFIK